jgi:hypothetical protein
MKHVFARSDVDEHSAADGFWLKPIRSYFLDWLRVEGMLRHRFREKGGAWTVKVPLREKSRMTRSCMANQSLVLNRRKKAVFKYCVPPVLPTYRQNLLHSIEARSHCCGLCCEPGMRMKPVRLLMYSAFSSMLAKWHATVKHLLNPSTAPEESPCQTSADNDE